MSIPKFLAYLKIEKNYSPKTLESYSNDLNAFQEYCSFEVGVDDLSKIERINIRTYLMHLSQLQLSERSINRKLSSLKSYYKFLQKIGEIEQSPVSLVSTLKFNPKIQLPMAEEELSDLFEMEGIFPDGFLGLRDRLMMELFYQTGIRRAELINLKISDVDLEQKSIKVLGKGNKSRLIPIGTQLMEILGLYLRERDLLFPNNNTELFLTEKGKAFYDKLVYNLVNSYLSHVSTKLKKSPHILRHSFATHLLNRGAELNAVKELLGHSSLAATQVYTHSSIDELKKVFNQAHPRSDKN